MSDARNLPAGWVWAQFREVAAVESDLVDPGRFSDVPHIAPNHIESKTGRLLPYATIGIDKVRSPKHRFCAGQILYSKIRPYLAKAVLADFDGLCSADMYPLSTGLEPRFLLRWLLSDEFTARVSLDQGRTVLPKVNQAALAEIGVPVPPIAEQRRIVAKLEALLSRSRRAKEALDAIPALLERFRQSVLAAAFRGDLTRDWREKNPDMEPASELLERIRAERRRRWEEAEIEKMRARGRVPSGEGKERYEEPKPVDQAGLPDLPDGWTWASVEEVTSYIVDCLHRTPEYRDAGYPAIRTADVVPGRLLLDQARRVDEKTYLEQIARLVPKEGDIFYSREGERLGLAACVPKSPRICVSQRMMHLRAAFGMNAQYFMWALNSPLMYQQATGGIGGSTSPHVNIGDIKRFAVPVAPTAEQDQIAGQIEQLWLHAGMLGELSQEATEKCGELAAALLSKAFRGELVPQDPNDEPASVLLERIKAEREQQSDHAESTGRRKGRRQTKVA